MKVILRIFTLSFAVVVLWLGGLGPAWGQPVLERLEQRLRERLDEGAKPKSPTPRPPLPGGQAPAVKEEPGYLGAVADDKSDRGRGVRVLSVRPGGPAEKSGLRKDDLIVSAAGIRVRQMSDLADVLQLFAANEDVMLEVVRGGVQQKVKVTLGRRPADGGAEAGPEIVPPPRAEQPAGPTLAPTLAPPPAPAPAPTPAPPSSKDQEIEQLRRRVEQLEQRIETLERKLSESAKK